MAKRENGSIIQSSIRLLVWRGNLLILQCILIAGLALWNGPLGGLHRVFDRARSGCKHSKSFKRVNMQDKHGGSMRSHNYYLKRYVLKKQFNTIQFLCDEI